MKNIIAAIALSTVANIAAADGFAPWETRAVKPDTNIEAAHDVESTGFTPWHKHTEIRDVLDTNTSFSAMPVNGFRPWG